MHQWLNKHAIPAYTFEALYRYVMYRLPPGGFLTAVLANEREDAVLRADDNNKHYIDQIFATVEEHVPEIARGDRGAIKGWLQGRPTAWSDHA